MINEDQKHSVGIYLQNLTFNEKEFFEEMYDHICSSFENREDEQQTVRQHIYQVVEPAFGGKEGLRKIQQTQARARKKLVYKRALSLFSTYLFRWPTVLITAILFLLLWQLNQLFDQVQVFEMVTTIGLLTPFFVSNYGKWRFQRQCKQHKMPYDNSQVNNTIHFLSISGVALLFGLFSMVNRWAFGNRDGFLDFFSQYPVSFLPISTILLVYALVCLQLFKEKFQLKLV